MIPIISAPTMEIPNHWLKSNPTTVGEGRRGGGEEGESRYRVS
jgi:hypothetical protein